MRYFGRGRGRFFTWFFATPFALLTGCALQGTLAPAARASIHRPNFVVILSDDQRADTLRAWGNRHISTPHLDRLAREGFSFRRNYCFGSNSGAVCIPSRAMLMSGRTWLDVPNHLADVPLLPELLRNAGYRTFATGKWHNEQASFSRAFQSGRAVFFGGMADPARTPIVDYQDGRFSPVRTAPHSASEAFADAAIGFLESCSSDEPYFCYVAFTAPHDPRNPPPELSAPYHRRRPPLPRNYLPQHPFDHGWTLGLRDEDLAPYPRPPEVIREQLADYYGLITHMDAQIGRILAAIERQGQADRTYVIFASDSGLALGSHGLMGKQSLYEHSMRTPLVIKGPDIPAGRSTEAFTYLFDLFPTVLQLGQVRLTGHEAGASLQPLWTRETQALRDSVFLPFTDTIRSVRDERWKLICYPQINRHQLFDLRNDPHERHDRAQDPRHAPIIERLLDLMRSWQSRTGDRQPLTVASPRSDVLRTEGYRRTPDPWQPAWIVDKYFRDAPLPGRSAQP